MGRMIPGALSSSSWPSPRSEEQCSNATCSTIDCLNYDLSVAHRGMEGWSVSFGLSVAPSGIDSFRTSSQCLSSSTLSSSSPPVAAAPGLTPARRRALSCFSLDLSVIKEKYVYDELEASLYSYVTLHQQEFMLTPLFIQFSSTAITRELKYPSIELYASFCVDDFVQHERFAVTKLIIQPMPSHAVSYYLSFNIVADVFHLASSAALSGVGRARHVFHLASSAALSGVGRARHQFTNHGVCHLASSAALSGAGRPRQRFTDHEDAALHFHSSSRQRPGLTPTLLLEWDRSSLMGAAKAAAVVPAVSPRRLRQSFANIHPMIHRTLPSHCSRTHESRYVSEQRSVQTGGSQLPKQAALPPAAQTTAQEAHGTADCSPLAAPPPRPAAVQRHLPTASRYGPVCGTGMLRQRRKETQRGRGSRRSAKLRKRPSSRR